MPGLAHDPGVVSARRQTEGHVGVRQKMQLVDRTPGRHVVACRADREHRHADVADGDRAPVDLVATLRQVVVQEQPAQILRMHAERHAREIGVPGHEIVHLLPAPEQILVDDARPDQIVRPDHLERPGHLMGIEIALVPHQVLKIRDLALVDEQHDLAGFREVGLRGEGGHGLEAVVAVARHRRGGDREQGAAQAVAHRVHLALGHDRAHRVERRHEPQAPVIVEPEIGVFRGRVLPRDHEDRVALIHEVELCGERSRM